MKIFFLIICNISFITYNISVHFRRLYTIGYTIPHTGMIVVFEFID